MGTYAKIQKKRLQRLFERPFCALLSHWLFQSLCYMDTTERWFKIGFDLLITFIIAVPLTRYYQGMTPWFVSFFLAHTLNFLLNGQLWGVLKHYGVIRLRRSDFEKYVLDFRRRARAQTSIEQVLIYGSLARGEWKAHSDLDARIIRKPGIRNGLAACIFLMSERTRALFYAFPLDVYVLDGTNSRNLLLLSEPGKDLLAGETRFIS